MGPSTELEEDLSFNEDLMEGEHMATLGELILHFIGRGFICKMSQYGRDLISKMSQYGKGFISRMSQKVFCQF